MSTLTNKYSKLAECALEIIQIDNKIIKLLETGDPNHLLQMARDSRILPLLKVKQLAAWTPTD